MYEHHCDRGHRDLSGMESSDIQGAVPGAALIASVLPANRRNYAFGLFYVGYGCGWLIGSVTAGLLYEQSRVALVIFAVTVQLLSIPFFLLGTRADRNTSRSKAA
jgi:MFS family permease